MSGDSQTTPQAALIAKLRAEMDDEAAWRSAQSIIEVQFATIERLHAALVRLRDCDWTIGRGDRMDPVRDIARAALEGRDDRPHP